MRTDTCTVLESGDHAGAAFGQVVLRDGSGASTPIDFWELSATVALPKMSNVQQFMHPGLREPESFKGDYSKIIILTDPPFNKGEVHYRQTDLIHAGKFDVASTFENYMEPHPALVVSQRLYEYCLKRKVKLIVDPVRIDPS